MKEIIKEIIKEEILENTYEYKLSRKSKPYSGLDYIIIDEAHGLKLDNKSTDIVYKSNAKLRIGLTGTLPDDEVSKMAVLSCTGAPVRYIRTQGLIERGLATPVHINTIQLRYSSNDQALFKSAGLYVKSY
jgi:superfamily II DNA or RNA helicase